MTAAVAVEAVAGIPYLDGEEQERVDRSVVLRRCRVRTDDGVELATDVYLPGTGTGPWPAILERTPYHRERGTLVRAALSFSRHGYAFVLQDVRGRFGSGGDWWLAVHEAEDGRGTVEWIARQPWCDGRVATTGLSYSNSTQAGLATLRPEGLAAQVRCQGQSSYHVSGFRMQGGAMDGRMIPYLFQMALSDRRADADPLLRQRLEAALQPDRIRQLMLRGTLVEGTTPLAELPSYERSLIDVLTHGEFDEFWHDRTLSPQRYYDDVPDIPILLVGSWYDMHTIGTLRDYVALRERLSQPVRLVMGPWVHGEEQVRQSHSGDVEFGGAAAFDYDDERRLWFDTVVRGEATGLLDQPPVKLFVMGGGSGRRRMDAPAPTFRLDHGGRWRWEHEWPLARTRWTPHHLHPGGALVAEEPPATSSVLSYRFDPRDPVPSIGGSMSRMGGLAIPGGHDQRDPRTGIPLIERPDVLSFQTPPLPDDVEVTGPVTATLYVTTDAPDTDFTVKLVDVYPPSDDHPEGYALNLLDGIVRMRYRNGVDVAVSVEPGEVCEVHVDLAATSNRFMRGHRIRVDVSSSNHPKYDVNPNTGDPLGRHRGHRAAWNTLHLGPERPSHVLLPVIPVR